MDQTRATEQIKDRRFRPIGFWPIALVGLVFGVVVIAVMPANLSILGLVALVLFGLVVAARDADLSWQRIHSGLGELARGSRDKARGRDVALPENVAGWGKGLLFVSCGLMVVSAMSFRPGNVPANVNQGAILMLVGGVMFGIGLVLSNRLEAPPALSANHLLPMRSDWLVTTCGVVLLGLVAEINGKVLDIDLLQRVSFHAQFALFVLGIGLITWGLSGAPALSISRDSLKAIQWRTVLPLLCIFLLALTLRMWGLKTSLRSSVDEAVAIDGYFYATYPNVPGLVSPPSQYISTGLYPYLQTWAVALLGHTLEGLRATSALTGALTVFAIFLLADALFDRKTAFIAAFLLATLPPHIHFSRIALVHIADPLVGTLALAFLTRALKDNRRVDWALAGVCLGLTEYFFEAGRLFYPVLVVGWMVIVAITMRRQLLSRLRGLSVMALAATFTAAPVYYTIFAKGLSRAARLDDSGLGGGYWSQLLQGGLTPEVVTEILRRLGVPFQVFVHQPDMAVFYGGQQPLVLEYLVPLFLLGVFYLIWRRGFGWVVALWIVGTALGNSLLRDSAVYARYVVVLPALALAIAVALRYVLPLLLPVNNRRLAAASVVLAVGVVGGLQSSYYFDTHLPKFETQIRNYKPDPDGIDAAMRAATLPPDTSIYLVSNYDVDANVPRNFLSFLIPDPMSMTMVSIRVDQLDDAMLSGLPRDKNYAFFVGPNAAGIEDLLGQYFPLENAQMSPYDIPAEKEYALYFVPRSPDTP
jgi:4-amino-4-deoxy-L-arabinose transferase-like glycosyltransferase